ncbi:MAG: phosphotransferase [Pseudomonadota bacterium]
MSRTEDLHHFLAEAGLDPARVTPLAGDASNRRYYRLCAEQVVVMDSPRDRGEDVTPFVAVTNWLRDGGFSAPAIHAADLDRGFLLLEDLGDDLFRRVCARTPALEGDLYGNAVDLLVELHRLAPPATLETGVEPLPLTPYDHRVLMRESDLLTQWYLPGTTDHETPGQLAAEFSALMEDLTRPVAEARAVVVLRDYHAENLIWLPARQNIARTGLLDYQDALAGHQAYDLVSLLEDARRDTSQELRDAMIGRYLKKTGAEPGAFRSAYARLGAQRNIKIIGIFARLCLRDGKAQYPDLIPRVWEHLMRDLEHPDLHLLKDWVARHVPVPEPSVISDLRRRAGALTAERA